MKQDAKQEKEADESQRPKRPWRESIEGLTVAIVMAVFLKYFIIEAYKIPSGSMQPTLMGSPETGIFDRILVDKLSYHLRDPQRFEVVVFKHPLNRALNMIKRLVGMPGESLRIYNGDLWRRESSDEDWQVLRRPKSVQRGMWRKLPTDGAWRVEEGSTGFKLENDQLQASGRGAIAFPAPGLYVRNNYTDGYPPEVAKATKRTTVQAGKNPVGDLRVSGRLEVSAQCSGVVIELEEGPRRYRFEVPGPASQADTPAAIVAGGYENAPGRVVASEPVRLRAGKGMSFAAENLDDRLRLELDGEIVAELEVPSSSNQRSRVRLEVESGSASWSELEVFRDIYYLDSFAEVRQSIWDPIPEGHYVVLGDNTLDSADARLWQRALIEVGQGSGSGLEPGTVLEGNYRGGRDYGDTNPYTTRDHTYFRDKWGEVWAFPLGTARDEISREPGPTVPRELVMGRAVSVFWPVSLRYGVSRFSWIR